MTLSYLSWDRGHFRNSNDKNEKFSRLRGTRLKARASLIKYFLCVFCSSRSIYFPQVWACNISPTRHISGCWQLSALLLSPCMLVSWAVTSRTAWLTLPFTLSTFENGHVCMWIVERIHETRVGYRHISWLHICDLKTNAENHLCKSYFLFILFECLNALWLVYVVYGIELIPAPATCWVFTRLNTRH